MFDTQNLSLASYFFPCFFADQDHASHDTERTHILTTSLSTYVDLDHGDAIRALFSTVNDAQLLTSAIQHAQYAPLHKAIEKGHIEAFRAMVDYLPLEHLIAKTPNTEQSLLMRVAHEGQHRMLSWLLSKLFTKFIELHFQDTHPLQTFDDALNEQDADGNTALMLATKAGHEASARVLISFCPNVFVTNRDGLTVLHLVNHLPPTHPLAALIQERYQSQLNRL